MQLPNIRATIIPDPGQCLIEIDLKQADAQVVAWESNDDNLKTLFRLGVDIYTETQTGVWSDPALPQSRQIRKNCIHSVDYGAGYRTLAERYVGTERAAKHFLSTWFAHHPSIAEWHRRIAWDMQQSTTPIIRNIWGYRRVYACATPITQPLAWIGQGTVAIVNKLMLKAYEYGIEPPPPGLPATEMLQHYASIEYRNNQIAQIVEVDMPHHDSVLLQVPQVEIPSIFPELLRFAAIPIPYSDPLTIPAELKYSDRSWGHMQKWSPDDPT